FRVDARQRVLLLKLDGRPLPLSSRAFDTLLFFLEHPGELLDKSTLMKAVWPNVIVEENNLNQHISALRRVLGERPEEHRFIVTIPGRGYRFVAPVRPVTDGSDPTPEGPPMPAVAPAPIAAATPGSAATTPARQPAPRNRLLWALSTVALALAAALAWYLTPVTLRRTSPIEHASTATSIEVVPVLKPRLPVLPFENLSPDPSNAFFADGLHEEIVSTIAERVPGVE